MSKLTESLERSLKDVLEMKNPERTFTNEEVKYLAGLVVYEYKGYTATVDYEDTDKLFYGRIDKINDLVNFHGTTLKEFEEAFHRGVDEYIEFCGEVGKEPEKPV